MIYLAKVINLGNLLKKTQFEVFKNYKNSGINFGQLSQEKGIEERDLEPLVRSSIQLRAKLINSLRRSDVIKPQTLVNRVDPARQSVPTSGDRVHVTLLDLHRELQERCDHGLHLAHQRKRKNAVEIHDPEAPPFFTGLDQLGRVVRKIMKIYNRNIFRHWIVARKVFV